MKPILLVTCTKHSPKLFKKKAAIAPYIEAHKNMGNIQESLIAYENKKGLPQVYNSVISEQYRNWIVLCVHDDIELYNIDLAARLNNACRQFDIVGVAGNSYHDPQQSPVTWGNLPGKDLNTRSGQITHMRTFNVADRKAELPFTYTFGPSWVPVKVIDGVLISFNVDACLRHNHRFDEQFDFHFYDLDFSYGASQRGMTVGTCDIYIKHYSHGNYNSEKWSKAEEAYMKKWREQP
jgi:hypothetical protein